MAPRQYTPEIQRRLKQLANQDLYLTRTAKADVAGKRYGRLEVIRAVGHGKNGRLLLLCHCDCGGATITMLDSLNNGTKSCGCLRAEIHGGKLGGQVFRGLQRLAMNGGFKPLQRNPISDQGNEIDPQAPTESTNEVLVFGRFGTEAARGGGCDSARSRSEGEG